MDDAQFTAIDAKLFDRLHRGSPAPLTFRLRDGRALTGELLAIRRHGATGSAAGAPAGEIWVSAEGGPAPIAYDQIEDIE